MAKQVSVLSVFVASPSDVDEERELLEDVIRELNLQWTSSRGVQLELVRWETHAYPGVSTDPQQVINEQIGDEYDIFLGILWKKFGTPTPRSGSGTEEEFNRALARHSKESTSLRILFYFKTAGTSLSDIDPSELIRVREFRSKLGPKGTLYWEFGNAEEFPSLLRLHLSRCVDDWGKKWGTGSPAVTVGTALSAPKSQEVQEDEGFLDLVETATLSFELVKDQIDRIGESTFALGSKIDERTKEIEQATQEGGQIDLKLAKRICNAAADNLESYATLLDAEVPLFAAKFTDAVNSYAKAAAMLTDFRSDGGETLQQIGIAIQTAAGLRSSIDGALQSLGGFRQSIASSPRVTTQYNHAKRHALAILDRFLTEIKSGSDRLAECQKLLGGIRAELPVSPVSAL